MGGFTISSGGRKLLLLLLLVGLGYYAWQAGWIKPAADKPSVVLDKTSAPDLTQGPATTSGSTSNTTGSTSSAPATTVQPVSASGLRGPQIRIMGLTWNAQAGMLYAIGGEQTAPGSLLEKAGVNVKFTYNDDVPQQMQALREFAYELCVKGVAHPTKGMNYLGIMGDAAGGLLAENYAEIEKMGNGCGLEIIFLAGRSAGEDKLMGPPEWKTDPQKARGGLIAGVLRDGDINVAWYWAQQNKICINPDEKTYDKHCLNFLNTNSFNEAGEKYLTGFKDSRKVVESVLDPKTGEVLKVRETKQTIQKEVNAVGTWTPGDVTIARKKGGLVSIASTYEYKWQMPHVLIGNKKWNAANRNTVLAMLRAFAEGGEAVKTSPAALRKASEISYRVYKQGDGPQYWEKYFTVQTERDAQGLMVELGGSAVNNLADNMVWLGMTGDLDMYRRSYEHFGGLAMKLYPELVKSIPPYSKLVNKSYIAALAEQMTAKGQADVKTYTSQDRAKRVVARKAWQIGFIFGKSEFTPQGVAQLEEMFNEIVLTEGPIELHGYTDAIGGDGPQNQSLSERRAYAVKNWMVQKSKTHFPPQRIRVVGHGPKDPIGDNSTEEGRELNRRVEVLVGTN